MNFSLSNLFISSAKGRVAEMDQYIQRMQAQAARLEEELEECDELIHRTDLGELYTKATLK